ncbi:hypothetical protein Salat_1122000 [Sesamum alatum]|uniref:Uncharacterized protein n=1 Tax=Sesamum alatum TaxID=300844 RepID=A0AAE2CNB9_9LAMI|nr:hypothetical protein Salat_1122000 [Sesamum alatum]
MNQKSNFVENGLRQQQYSHPSLRFSSRNCLGMWSSGFRATGALNPHHRTTLFLGLAANTSFRLRRKAEAALLSSRFSATVDERGESNREDEAELQTMIPRGEQWRRRERRRE